MSLIDEALSANATIANDYDPDRAKPPAPKIAIVTCADPRLSNIEQMLGLAEADVDMIRNLRTVIDDDAIRSLVLSTRLLGSREIMIINHTDCGMLRFTDSEMEERLRKQTGQAPIAPGRPAARRLGGGYGAPARAAPERPDEPAAERLPASGATSAAHLPPRSDIGRTSRPGRDRPWSPAHRAADRRNLRRTCDQREAAPRRQCRLGDGTGRRNGARRRPLHPADRRRGRVVRPVTGCTARQRRSAGAAGSR